MPKDKDKIEDMAATAETERHAARSLQEAANSDNSLEGYAAINGLGEKDEIARKAEKKPPRKSAN